MLTVISNTHQELTNSIESHLVTDYVDVEKSPFIHSNCSKCCKGAAKYSILFTQNSIFHNFNPFRICPNSVIKVENRERPTKSTKRPVGAYQDDT